MLLETSIIKDDSEQEIKLIINKNKIIAFFIKLSYALLNFVKLANE
tara:strand:+ start:241 stop:378 length:138 start_codon:yes stop_codon:yes gene_type:complete